MADELNGKVWDMGGIPLLLEWEDAEQQIEVARHFVRTAFPRGPDLRRDILDYFGLPIEKRPRGADLFSDRMGEPAVEAGKIDTDDRVGLALNRKIEQAI